MSTMMGGVDSLPYLTRNSPESCPVSMERLIEFLHRETLAGESLRAGDLEFVRTARVVHTRYWLWRFVDQGNVESFVTGIV
jgi:hypothetical protein